MAPAQVLAHYPADAVRYWAASTGLGRDTLISEEKIQAGARLLNKLWNVARFSEPFLGAVQRKKRPDLSPADAWILARLQVVVAQATQALEGYDHVAAKSAVEAFFWGDLADNYLEMAKKRLYDGSGAMHQGACWTLDCCLRTTVKLLAPFLPYVTEAIYQALFARQEGGGSVHRASWPEVDESLCSASVERMGAVLLAVGTAVRRCKSAASRPLSTPLERLQVVVPDPELRAWLPAAAADIASLTRARRVEVGTRLDAALQEVQTDGEVSLGLDWGQGHERT